MPAIKIRNMIFMTVLRSQIAMCLLNSRA
jgi:hypothetical protein